MPPRHIPGSCMGRSFHQNLSCPTQQEESCDILSASPTPIQAKPTQPRIHIKALVSHLKHVKHLIVNSENGKINLFAPGQNHTVYENILHASQSHHEGGITVQCAI